MLSSLQRNVFERSLYYCLKMWPRTIYRARQVHQITIKIQGVRKCLIFRKLNYLSIYLSISIYLKVSNYFLSIYLLIFMYIYISIFIYLPTWLSINTFLSIYLSIYLFIQLSVYLFFYLSIYLSLYLSIYISISLFSLWNQEYWSPLNFSSQSFQAYILNLILENPIYTIYNIYICIYLQYIQYCKW